MIRISGVGKPSCCSYGVLRTIGWASYTERTAAENARALRENELDVALIPVDDYAFDGPYLGLDFGLALDSYYGPLYLYTPTFPEEVSRIFVPDDARSSLSLIRQLWKSRWRREIEIVQHVPRPAFSTLLDDEAVSFQSYPQPSDIPESGMLLDLGREWKNHTGRPFVAYVWAARPGVMTFEQHRELNEVLHRCSRIRGFLASDHADDFDLEEEACADYVQNSFVLYLDDRLTEAVQFQIDKGALDLRCPRTRYYPPLFTVKNKHVTPPGLRSVEEALNDLSSGIPICLGELQQVLEHASVSDLSLACQLRGLPDSSERPIEIVKTIQYSLRPSSESDSQMLQRVLIPAGSDQSLSALESVIAVARSAFPGSLIEAVDLASLESLIQASGKEVIDSVSRLRAAGLDAVRVSFEGRERKVLECFHKAGGRSVWDLNLNSITPEGFIAVLRDLCDLQLTVPGVYALRLFRGDSEDRSITTQAELRLGYLAVLYCGAHVPVIVATDPQEENDDLLMTASLYAQRIEIESGNGPLPSPGQYIQDLFEEGEMCGTKLTRILSGQG